ncbi:hypothetical protein [Thiomicrospira sp.]|uniref:hypothetical protein n=1 Tax=Thiomicrospira sp. TaxID=935 RepID=UPI002F953EA8
MENFISTQILALWGAVLSSMLAGIKIYEFWGNRFRVNTRSNFTSDHNEGNQISIRNLNKEPIILEHWELYYKKGYWPFAKLSEIASPGPESCDTQIKSHNSLTLYFTDGDHFSWRSGRKIVIKLWIAGRRPFYRTVYKG